MKLLKWLGVFAVLFICFAFPMKASAADDPADGENTGSTDISTTDPLLRGPALIATFRNALYYDNGTLDMIMQTIGTECLAEIGFHDIVVQKSSDNIHWTDSMFFGDRIETFEWASQFEMMVVPPDTARYYRVYVTHYAKEDAFWFPAEQIVRTYSNVVYVP